MGFRSDIRSECWAGFSSLYQGTYLGTEGIVTLVIISLPPVTKALNLIHRQASA